MLAGSLVFHGGLVGVAALWPQSANSTTPLTPVIDVVDVDISQFPGSKDLAQLPPVLESPSPVSENQLTPPVDDKPVTDTPLPVEDPEMSSPDQATPAPRKSSPRTAAKPSTASSSAVGQREASGNGTPGAGNPGSSRTTGAGWMIPRPSYPKMSTLARPTGTTRVRCTTDASGEVTGVVIVQSAGSAVLDNYTTNFVRTHWKGPPNASREVVFVYQVK